MRSFFLFFSLFLINCNNSDTIELDINDKIILPKNYIVNKINDQINIDGRDDEIALFHTNSSSLPSIFI